MKKIYVTLILFSFILFGLNSQNRYLEPVFDEITVETVVYASNYSVLSGAPVLIDLEADIYTAVGDTATNRPLFIYFHTGNFLPSPLNGGTGGTRNDSTVVEIATRLTQMGYVVAVVDYRLGWNPVGDLDTRISTLINAAYRGIQDARSAVRFFRKDAVDLGNNFGIDSDNIAYFGQGTGGYISFGAATLDQYSDILIPKFFGPDITGDGNPDPYVLQPIHGDPFGTSFGIHPLSGDTLSRPNHVTYADGSSINSDVQLSVNLGGALADTSWVTPNNPPMVSFHVPTDPFAPYKEDVLIVPTTGDLIVEVQGSYLAQYKANELGLNDIFIDAGINDNYTIGANANNDGLEGLYPLIQPIEVNPFNQQPAPQTAPWEWWSVQHWSQEEHPSCGGAPVDQCNFHVINSIFNQDMSAEKARTYIDTIIGYLAPRAFLAFGLELDTDVRELDQSEVNFSFYPNPVSSILNFKSDADKPILTIKVYDINGRLIKNYNSINNHLFQFDVTPFAVGMHFIKVHFNEGVLVKRVVFQ